MGGITIDWIFEVAKWLVAGGSALFAIYKAINVGIKKIFEQNMKHFEDKLDDIDRRLDEAARDRAKNFIIRVLADIEQGEHIDEDELQCFWDNYDKYTALHGNSYVHEKVERLKREGKL